MDSNATQGAASARPTWHRWILIAGVLLLAGVGLAWAQSAQALPPPTVALAGHVSLQGRPAAPHASWSIPLYVSICPLGSPVTSTTVTTDQSGNFVIPDLPEGFYSISVKGEHTLRVLKDYFELTSPTTTVSFGVLPEGDTNYDNTVNAIDASALGTSYWKSQGEAGFEHNADFNEDDYIDARDASLLATNYWETGDPMPAPTIPPPTIPADESKSALAESLTEAPAAVAEPSQAIEGVADISITPPLTMVHVGQIFTLTVQIDASEQIVQAADVFVQFDPRFIQVVDGAGRPATTVVPITDPMSMVLANAVDNQAGLISYAVMETTDYAPSAHVRLFQIPIRAVAPTPLGGTSLSFGFDDAQRRVTRLAYVGQDVLGDNYPATMRAFSSNVVVLPHLIKERSVGPYQQ